jgi:type IV secretory pathway TraG/TraD family ATPase VirD4
MNLWKTKIKEALKLKQAMERKLGLLKFRDEAAEREESVIKTALRPISRRLMYYERKIHNQFPTRPGWAQFTLAGAKLPPHSETQHKFVCGMPGVGKSIALEEHLGQVDKNGQPAIIFDPSGEFTEKFYRDGRDIIMSPFDVRSADWNLFKELRLAFDITNIAEALIEAPVNGEKFWASNARILFSDLVKALDRAGLRTNADLYHYANEMPLGDLFEFLKGTHGGTLMDPASEKTAIGIRAQLGSTMAAWPFLKDSGVPFSLREFIRQCDNPAAPEYGRRVFLTTRGDAHSLMKPLISLWMEIVCSGILSLPPRADRRIHIVIDELPSLQKLPSLETLMAQGRKFGASITLAIQLFSQLVHEYGRDKAEAIVGNSGTTVCFRAGEPTTAKFMSAALGNREVKEKKENRTMSTEEERDSISFASEKRSEEAFTSGEILHLKTGEAILKTPNMPLVKLNFRPQNRPKIAEGYVLRPELNWETVMETQRRATETIAELANTDASDGYLKTFLSAPVAAPRQLPELDF